MSKLKNILKEAVAAPDRTFGLDKAVRDHLGVVLKNACSGQHKAVLAVVLTLSYKKHTDPEQDIRLHKAGLRDGSKRGFSGRGLDSKEVTPFLREENFPYMAAGSGWLTRSLEQSEPYSFNYRGAIRPAKLKASFLQIVDRVEHGEDPLNCMKFILRDLHDWRVEYAKLRMAKPLGKGITEIVSLIKDHWERTEDSASRLPVLAVFAAYQRLTLEVKRYKKCKLQPLLPHNAADSKTGRAGDIQVNGDNNLPMEAVEIKHKIPITERLVDESMEKATTDGAKTYYILSTNEKIAPNEMTKITQKIQSAKRQFGCQIIVNGVATTLKYYLRLMADTDEFVHEYVKLMESDRGVAFGAKRFWNELVARSS